MKFKNLIIKLPVFILTAGVSFFCFSYVEGAVEQSGLNQKTVIASIRTARVEERVLTNLLMVYGRIIPAPGSTRSLAIPFECRIGRIFVTEGQQVKKGDPLLELSPSPATFLMVESVENSLEAAKLQLDKVRERVRMKLATARELIQTEKEYNLAALRVKNLKDMKIAENITINSRNNEMIIRLYCRVGQIITSGAPLMDIVDGNMVEAAAGVEPEDARLLKIGQAVFLTPVNRKKAEKLQGRIRTISQAVNASSRLIDTFIQVPQSSDFLINEFVKAEIILDKKRGMVVPRSAVLPDKKVFICFTVENGHALRHTVKKGWEGRDYVEVISSSIKPGDEIVIRGNYELSDRMPVKIISDGKQLSRITSANPGQES